MGTVAVHFLIGFIFLTYAGTTFAHSDAAGAGTSIPLSWNFEPWLLALLFLSMGLYLAGALRLWQRQRLGRPLLARQMAAFAIGWLALVAALVSPLDTLGGLLFSAHMLQHELLMIVAAPLLVLGRPLAVWLWAMPHVWRQALGGAVRWPAISASWGLLTHPVGAWLLHAAALWLWHVPALFQAALADTAIHTAQHFSFLLSALLFWWAALGGGTHSLSRASAMLSLFTTMLHTGALGALLTVSDKVWYPAYALSSSALGLEPIEDQQLGGLIMWIPGGLAYVFAGLALGWAWLVERHPNSKPAIR